MCAALDPAWSCLPYLAPPVAAALDDVGICAVG
jgi:hypothetical protein